MSSRGLRRGFQSRTYIIVAVKNPDSSAGWVDSIIEFLANEHFSVVEIDPRTRQATTHPTVGDSFYSHPVYVTTLPSTANLDDDVRRLIRTAVGFRQGLRSGEVQQTLHWIEFDGASATKDHLDRLLSKVTRISLTSSRLSEIRDVAEHRSAELFRLTRDRYESAGFLDDYAEKWGDCLPQAQLDLFLSRMPPGARILDAGCGPGHHSRFMSDRGHTVAALDITAAAMRVASRDRHARTSLVRADISSLPFKPRTFDGIWCCATLVHFPVNSLARPLNELGQVLKPRGILSFSVSLGKLPAVDPDGRFFDSFRDESEVCEVCQAVDLSVVASRVDVSGRTTSGGVQLARWLTVIVKPAGPAALTESGSGEERPG